MFSYIPVVSPEIIKLQANFNFLVSYKGRVSIIKWGKKNIAVLLSDNLFSFKSTVLRHSDFFFFENVIVGRQKSSGKNEIGRALFAVKHN